MLVFLFWQTDPGGTYRNVVAWFRPETSKGAIQPKLFYFISYRLSNQPLWERPYARKYLFGIQKSAGAMFLPETWIETVRDYGFFKVLPRILCNHKHPFIITYIFNSICRLFTKCKGGGWADVIPTPGFQSEKAVCYLVFSEQSSSLWQTLVQRSQSTEWPKNVLWGRFTM